MDYSRGNNSLISRARWAKISAYAVLAPTFFLLFFQAGFLSGLINLQTASPALGTTILWTSYTYTAAYLLSVILVSMWIHRAHKNMHEADYGGLSYTPGWAVGWFFVPIACLFKPMEAMRELWNNSVGGNEEYSSTTPALVRNWWILWILANITSMVSGQLIDFADTSSLPGALEIISSCTFIGCALLLIKIIGQITEAQASGLHAAEAFE